MVSFQSTVRRALVQLLAAFLLLPLTAAALPMTVALEGYVIADGQRADYFNGKLLSAGDLNAEQSYKLGVRHYLGPTDLTLDDLFQRAGLASVFLSFDDSDAVGDNRSDPTDAHRPQIADLIFLDPDRGTWKGRLYLPAVGAIEAGVYDNLAGTFARLVLVPEPASFTLLILGLAGLLRAGAEAPAVRRTRAT